MRHLFLALCVSVVASTVVGAGVKTKPVDEQSTHQQTTVIKMAEESTPLKINAFCLNANGQIVAVCGNGPGEVRIINDDGKILTSWKTDVKPEAVNVADDGSVLVGGEGKLFRFDANGKELQQAEAPHAHALRTDNDALRKQAIASLKQRSASSSLASRITLYEQVIKQLEDKGKKSELNDQEMRMLEVLPKTLETFRKQAAIEAEKGDKKDEDDGPSEQQIQAYIKSAVASKMRISSISSSDEHVFVATRAIAGFGYDIWRMDTEFSNSKVIVTGLRGCCGQMDVQCCKNGIFVAENSRHRVVRYDEEGKEVTTFGKRDVTGVDGFSSCCNPMNVCFNGTGEVFTAESGTGRIKRFSPDGELVSYVGDVELVPGCKNVSIAVSPKTDKVYMLDLTRNHIVMMQPKPSESSDASAASVGG